MTELMGGRPVHSRWLVVGEKLLGTAVALLSLGSLVLASAMPLYTDETIWKMFQGRLGYDGGESLLMTMQPSCGQYTQPVPLLNYPFRWLDTLLYQDLPGPAAIRVLGVALALVWGILAWRLWSGAVGSEIRPRRVALALLGCMTIGIMPFLLVVSRPEQLLLICMTILLVPTLTPSPQEPPSVRGSVLRAAGVILLAAFMFNAHPRAVFVLPLALFFGWRVIGRPLTAGAAAIIVTGIAGLCYVYWGARWQCPGDPLFETLLAPGNISSAISSGTLPAFLKDLADKLSTGTNAWYLNGFVQKSYYTSRMLPPFAREVVPALDQLMTWAFLGFLTAGIGALLLFAREVLQRRASPVPLLAILSIWLFYALCVVVRTYKNDYESALIVPLLVFAAAGSLWIAREKLAALIGAQRLGAASRAALLLLLALSVVSQASLILSYYGYALGPWAQPGVPEGQRLSLSVFRYGELEPEIIATAGLCHIDPAAHPRYLVVDEVTYFTLRQAYRPIIMTYIEEQGWGRLRPDPTEMLRQYKSAGMVVGCERIPTALRDKAVSHGGFCCVPAFS